MVSQPIGECAFCDDDAVERDEEGVPLCAAHAEEWRDAQARAEHWTPRNALGEHVEP